jgi:hypothetical protein
VPRIWEEGNEAVWAREMDPQRREAEAQRAGQAKVEARTLAALAALAALAVMQQAA